MDNRRNWFEAVAAFPAVVLEEVVEFFKRVGQDEKEVLKEEPSEE